MSESQPGIYVRLAPGDLFPWKSLRGTSTFPFHSVAGRYLVFCFYRSDAEPIARSALDAVQRHQAFFDGMKACFFGISLDASDKENGRVTDHLPGVRFLTDLDCEVSRACGGVAIEPYSPDQPASSNPFWLIVDPTLHVLGVVPLGSTPSNHSHVFEFLTSLPAPGRFAGFEMPPPILVLPNVFDQQLCRRLIELYDKTGGSESGIHREGAGVHDHSFKRRKDFVIEDKTLIQHLQGLIARRVCPEIERLFFMQITRMERYIVGCYAAEDGAHFRPHRDNGPGLTAHRRYAVSINLSRDFEGGEVIFPEYSWRGFKAQPGWAVVFPANILHMVSKVTQGRRYAFLPFVYDEGGAKIRDIELALYHSASTPILPLQAAKQSIVNDSVIGSTTLT